MGDGVVSHPRFSNFVEWSKTGHDFSNFVESYNNTQVNGVMKEHFRVV